MSFSFYLEQFLVVVQLLSHVHHFVAPWTAACQASLSFTISQSLLKLMSIESVMPSNHLILCHPLLLWPSMFPSIRVFSNESVLHIRWPKYWSFSFRIGPSNEYSGLISFRIDWLDLLAVQGTFKSLLQHHSSKASVLQCSAFFMVQLSHPYLTTGKTIALTRWTFVSKVMFLLFNTLSRLYIYIYLLFFRFFSHMGHYRALGRVSGVIQQVLIIICFIYSSMCMSFPQFQFTPPPLTLW